ncbi:NAD(P)H-hydrate dehydratase [Sulfurimonas sp.]
MQNIFDEVASLDLRCYRDFFLSEDLLMEHAAQGMASYIKKNFSKKSTLTIVTGSGNNGADGIALARLLHRYFNISLFFAKEPKSKMALLQEKRVRALDIAIINELNRDTLKKSDIIIDALVGTGFDGEFNPKLTKVLTTLNAATAFKIACDVPSGLKRSGEVATVTFVADLTLTMGALKKSLFLDEAKDFVGKIEVLDLGIAREHYETSSNWHLLEQSDLELPIRTKQNSHKGSFGHLAIIGGEKVGASILAAQAALRFGAGLVTLLEQNNSNTPYEIMSSPTLPKNTTALALGMGLGLNYSQITLEKQLKNRLPLIIDADIFYMPLVLEILKRSKLVLTPHPKEFVQLLKITHLAEINIEKLQKNRFKYVELFCKNYPNAVLLLKGANVIIGEKDNFYINSHGSSKLAKGGSGDVLSGLIASLLAQGREPLNAAINASLTHTKLAQNYTLSDFSLTPNDLINGIGNL